MILSLTKAMHWFETCMTIHLTNHNSDNKKISIMIASNYLTWYAIISTSQSLLPVMQTVTNFDPNTPSSV